jgi:hypothetical protein
MENIRVLEDKLYINIQTEMALSFDAKSLLL